MGRKVLLSVFIYIDCTTNLIEPLIPQRFPTRSDGEKSMSLLTATRIVMRASILILLVLGVLFWTGNALALVPLHMLFGLLLVLGLWTVAGLAVSRGASPGQAVAAAILGLAVIGLGMTQTQLLPGANHWIIRVLHLLLGLGVMGMAERLARGISRAQAAPAA
jgi:hypothetical protein